MRLPNGRAPWTIVSSSLFHPKYTFHLARVKGCAVCAELSVRNAASQAAYPAIDGVAYVYISRAELQIFVFFTEVF